MQTLVAEILEAWRRAERLTNELPEGSPERAAAQSACERLRDLYHDLAPFESGGNLTEAEARRVLGELST